MVPALAILVQRMQDTTLTHVRRHLGSSWDPCTFYGDNHVNTSSDHVKCMRLAHDKHAHCMQTF